MFLAVFRRHRRGVLLVKIRQLGAQLFLPGAVLFRPRCPLALGPRPLRLQSADSNFVRRSGPLEEFRDGLGTYLRIGTLQVFHGRTLLSLRTARLAARLASLTYLTCLTILLPLPFLLPADHARVELVPSGPRGVAPSLSRLHSGVLVGVFPGFKRGFVLAVIVPGGKVIGLPEAVRRALHDHGLSGLDGGLALSVAT